MYMKWEDETARERTGHSPSYAEARKMKSLTLHTHGCPEASLRDRSPSSSSSSCSEYLGSEGVAYCSDSKPVVHVPIGVLQLFIKGYARKSNATNLFPKK